MVKLVRVKLNRPLYVEGRNEAFTLGETSEMEHIPTITEVVGYLTRFQKEISSDKYDWVKVNPFPNQIILNEEQQRAGDIYIKGKYISGIEEII